jgi:cytochrome c oxidase subunit 2
MRRIIVWALGAAAAAGCGDRTAPAQRSTPGVLDPKGDGASIIAGEMWIQFAVGAAMFVLVIGLLAGIVVVRSRRDATEELRGNEQHAQRWVLLGGVALPVVVLTMLVAVSARSLARLSHTPSREVTTIEVIGHQWWWEVRYPNDQITTANEIVVPVGQTVRLRLQSADVIHSLWIPQIKQKLDLNPDTWTTTWLRANTGGIFRAVCAEFCGEQHALMQLVVQAMPADRYHEWLAESRAPAPVPRTATQRLGQQLFLSTCAYCHTIAGTPARGAIGPDLTHLASRRTIVSGILPNRRGNLAGWILDPQRQKPGARMPATRLTGGNLQALLDYLESLK